jgi:hypothetical protein
MEAWFQKRNTGGVSVMIWTVISWYSILSVPLLPFMAKGIRGQVG